ncbi:MAG TPA: DUF4843 domain-containing protein [Bacteroidales bacterium]|nr:MAG: DUF4843 domain-containing protein [Bacteroidetes bacterium GWE2_42_24]OFY28714.1 MAG: DUF4843 domain-containing protein [Bacteroidetes bacterium GWF2_43_11]HBZ66185.1 DUF4843 domain-containing protein [Bacteroidales bacterium]
MLKKLSLKIVLLLVLLIVLNFVYKTWFYESDLQKNAELINLVRAVPNDADIVYIGESSNITFRGDDIDKRPISAFIGDYFPGLKTYDITKPASHAGIYKVLLENIPVESKVKTIVVTLNLRSFDAQWIYSNLETSLQKSLVLIKPYPPLFNRFLLSFKVFDIKSDSERVKEYRAKWAEDEFHMPGNFQFRNVIEWDRWMSNNGIKDSNGNYDLPQTDLACHFIKSFGFQLDTLKNPRISDFNAIIELARKRNWNLVFNLLAENTGKAGELVGNDLTDLMNENVQILENYYSRKGVVVVNNLNQVGNDQFVDQNWTTEHYAELGRRTVAKNVALALKHWYGDFYKEVHCDSRYQTSFFNDCDKGIIWGQMQTLTTDMAHSGEKSSMTGAGNDYSITFEYPLKVIPDSLKKTINVEFWLHQPSLNHDAKLVIQASGQGFHDYWNGYDIKSIVKDINVWARYNISISVPDSIKQADLIKIYVLNQSKEKIYIDDFKILVRD